MRWPLIRLLPRETHFRFVRYAPYAAVISAILVLVSCGSFVLNGLNFGTDFRGGTQIEIQTPGPAPLAQLRDALAKLGAKDPAVQGFGGPSAAALRFEPAAGVNPADAVAKVEASIKAQFPGTKITGEDVLGAKVSGELFRSGLLALGVAIGLMMVYIWFRFQLQFGLGAVAAVFHDVLLTLGLLSVAQIEFSMTSIARILGAPVMLPPGNEAASRSNGPSPGLRRPVTVVTRCCTAAVRSSRNRRGTRTLPGTHTRPRSLRSTSTIITFSAWSLRLASSSRVRARSPSRVRPRGRVPLIGSVDTRPPFDSARNGSGEAESRARGAPLAGEAPRSR